MAALKDQNAELARHVAELEERLREAEHGMP
jgi:hypothetical protein